MYLADDFVRVLRKIGLDSIGDQSMHQVKVRGLNHTIDFTEDGNWRHYPDNTIGHRIIGKIYSDWHKFEHLEPYWKRFPKQESISSFKDFYLPLPPMSEKPDLLECAAIELPLYESQRRGPTAGHTVGNSGPEQFSVMFNRMKDAVSIGGHWYPNDKQIPDEWNVRAGRELPSEQIFTIGGKYGVTAHFKSTGRSRSGRIIGEWRHTQVWNL